MLKTIVLFALFCLFSCNTPEARFEHLQHEFHEKYVGQDFFEIKIEEEVFLLPLPLASKPFIEQMPGLENLNKQANAIEIDKLNATQQKQLTQLRAVLNDFAKHASNPLFDPSRYSLPDPFKEIFNSPGDLARINLFLEKIPGYYAEVERRWQTPDARFVQKAIVKSQEAVDLLNKMQLEWKGLVSHTKIGAAKAAVKDFIGLCQSALLQ